MIGRFISFVKQHNKFQFFIVLTLTALTILILNIKANDYELIVKQKYIESSSIQTHFFVENINNEFNNIYSNMRTISFLPSVRGIDRHAKNFTSDSRETIQQIYNNIYNGDLKVSEVYIVPADLNPEIIDKVTGKPEEPIIMWDEFITFKNKTKNEVKKIEDKNEAPEEEIYEYRLMVKQFNWLKQHYPTIDRIDGLNIPMISGEEVITCDNTDFNRTRIDQDRKGIVFMVPFYGPDGNLKGGITTIVRSNALKALLTNGNDALINRAYDYINLPKENGQAVKSLEWIKRGLPDPSLIYSKVVPIQLPNSPDKWEVWSGVPNDVFYNSNDYRQVQNFRYMSTSLTVLLMLFIMSKLNSNERLRKNNEKLQEEIHAREILQKKLIISQERYALAEQGTNDGLFDWDLTTNRVYYSERWKKMLGFNNDEVMDSPQEWLARVNVDDEAKLKHLLENSIKEHQKMNYSCEFQMKKKDLSYIWVLTRWTVMYDEHNNPIRLVGSQTDINDRKELELKLSYSAAHDYLTGIPNRSTLIEELRLVIEEKNNHPDQLTALLLIDLNDFKAVNDSLGHVAGDELLIQLTQRIQEVGARYHSRLIARLGGDEFAILQPYTSDSPTHRKAADYLIEMMSKEFMVMQSPIKVSLSIGIAEIKEGVHSAIEVMRDADIALYQAKGSHTNRVKMFEIHMRHEQNKLFTLSQDLLKSIEENQIITFYQPIVDAKTGQISGVEALLRWKHEQYGFVSPDFFISMAEKNHFIHSLFQFVLMSACEFLSQAQLVVSQPLFASLNVSGYQFGSGDLLEDMKRALDFYELNANRLKIEITESTLIDFKSNIGEVLMEIKDAGIAIALDDFGTGYSSISSLYQFPFDYVKIDKSCIIESTYNSRCQNLIQGITQLAKSLNKKIIVEGVETIEQLNFIKSLDIDYVQGFYYSQALPGTQFMAWLEKKHAGERVES